MFAPHSELFTVSTVLFHKYGRENIGVANCLSRFSMSVPDKVKVKLSNSNA